MGASEHVLSTAWVKYYGKRDNIIGGSLAFGRAFL